MPPETHLPPNPLLSDRKTKEGSNLPYPRRSPRTPPEMTTMHQRFNQDNVQAQESTIERLQSRWNSGSRVIVDKPPSQPFNLRQMSRRPCRGSVKKSYRYHKDLVMGHSRRENTVARLQQSNSNWASSSGVITDSPPLRPSRVSALKHSGAMKHYDIFEDAKCILSMSRMQLSHTTSGTGTRINCTVSHGA
jgi:hypothetical protein